jgi:hypothetical protein
MRGQPYIQHPSSGHLYMHGGLYLEYGHFHVPCSLPHTPGGQPLSHVPRGNVSVHTGHRPTIDPVVIDRAAYEATGIYRESLYRSMNMTAPTMGPNTDSK